MGYCMNQRASDFFIAAEDKPAALRAIKALGERLKDLYWVSPDTLQTAVYLEPALAAARWPLKTNLLDGNIEGISFTGEEYGGDNILFDAIAPFVKAGSYIEMHGEDGAIWRWCFDGKTCKERRAKIVFDG